MLYYRKSHIWRKNIEAIILAGGLGSRLKDIVKDVPKPMADINGTPFLKYIVKQLFQNNIDHIIFSVGYKQEYIKDYFGSHYETIRISYSCENEPLGTGGALKQALEYVSDEYAFVLNGDTLFDINLEELYSKSLSQKNDVTVALKKMYDFDRYGSVILAKDGLIKQFNEKLFVSDGLINGGIYCVRKNIFSKVSLPKYFSFESDFLEKMVNKMHFSGCVSEKYFIDIGIPEDYEKAKIYFDHKKALFLDRDGIINKDKGYVYKIDDFEFIEGIFDLCRYFLERHYLIFIITNQAGIARGYYTENDFFKVTDWMKNEFKLHNITISEVYYCPHHPQGSIDYYTKECTCRKPYAGLIFEAQEKYNLNLEHSIVIGDKISDIEAGKSAEIGQTVLIKSHYQESFDFESIDIYLKYLRGVRE